jgi:hypothetical protein
MPIEHRSPARWPISAWLDCRVSGRRNRPAWLRFGRRRIYPGLRQPHCLWPMKTSSMVPDRAKIRCSSRCRVRIDASGSPARSMVDQAKHHNRSAFRGRGGDDRAAGNLASVPRGRNVARYILHFGYPHLSALRHQRRASSTLMGIVAAACCARHSRLMPYSTQVPEATMTVVRQGTWFHPTNLTEARFAR